MSEGERMRLNIYSNILNGLDWEASGHGDDLRNELIEKFIIPELKATNDFWNSLKNHPGLHVFVIICMNDQDMKKYIISNIKDKKEFENITGECIIDEIKSNPEKVFENL